MTKDLTPQSNELIFYSSPDGDVKVEVFFQEETFWLSQKKIGELFGKSKATISEHLKNIFETGELNEKSVVRKIRTTAEDGNIALFLFLY
jgi:hypothetical protein